jgi:hypothetical protein
MLILRANLFSVALLITLGTIFSHMHAYGVTKDEIDILKAQ